MVTFFLIKTEMSEQKDMYVFTSLVKAFLGLKRNETNRNRLQVLNFSSFMLCITILKLNTILTDSTNIVILVWKLASENDNCW